MTHSITEQDVRFYEEHGWIISPIQLDPALLTEAMVGLEQHWSGHRDHTIPDAGNAFSDWMPGMPEGTRNNEYLSLQNNRVRNLALAPEIGQVAAALTRSRAVRLFDDQMVYKPAGVSSAAVGWHVDGDYWQTCTSNNMLTAWIPLHDCPLEMGPLAVLDGSHKWSHLIDRSKLSFHSADFALLQSFVEDAGFEFKVVELAMQKGQFSFHHCRTLHCSRPNDGQRPRIALASHLQDDANRYRPATRPDGRRIELYNDRICRKAIDGDPDYSDPNVFPELWIAP
jgi:hypothetical protein